MTSRIIPGRAHFRYLATITAIAAIYFLVAESGFPLASSAHQVTAVGLARGLAFAAYVLFGIRVWPGVYLGALVANALSYQQLGTAAGIALGNTLPGLVAVLLLERSGGFDKSLESLRSVLGLVVIAAAGGAISATNGVENLVLGGIVPRSAFLSMWWAWWVGDVMGVLLVAPFLLVWIKRPWLRLGGWRLAELGALYILLGVVCDVAFLSHMIQTSALVELESLVFPFLIWAALRFGQRETASSAILIAAFAIYGTIHNRGAFATGSLDQRLILLEVFIALTTLTGFTLGAVTAERRRAERALRSANDSLELRVGERTAELAATNRELAAKNEEVEAFVYIVSHDLRAPLINLKGFAGELGTSCRELEEAIEAGPQTPSRETRIHSILHDDMRRSLHFISASTTKFQRLIDALLTLSRLGRQEYRSEKIDVSSLVGATMDSLQKLIATSGARISLGAMPGAVGDETAIGQVFANLIGNAVKYLHPGREGVIEIGGAADDGMAHYWVRDNGAGIPANAQRRLFQVFQRCHPDLAPGEGIGLALVKRVVERHGGKVWAMSEEGAGSTFHMTLPAAS